MLTRKLFTKPSWYSRTILLLGLILFSILAKSQNVNVSATSGTTTGTYASLNNAFAAINDGTHQGIIDIVIVNNTTEPALPTPLLKSDGVTSIYTRINIRPSGGNFIINSAEAPVANRGVIELAGADNVTIDGDDPLTSGDRNLSIISNPVATAGVACIRISSNSITGTDGADNITVKNCIIKGSRITATSTVINYGIQFSNGISTNSPGTGAYNSNNSIIEGNIIIRCYYGINAIGGSATYTLNNLQIKNNVIGSETPEDYVAFSAINLANTTAVAGVNSALISGNDLRSGHTAGTSTLSCISIGENNAGVKIVKNNIHDCINPSSAVWGMYGIGINSNTTGNTGILIANNIIRDIAGYPVSSVGNQYGGWGIYINAGITGVDIINNTIAQSGSIVGGCIYFNASCTVSKLLNNIFVITSPSNLSVGVYSSNTTNILGAVVNNNCYYVSSANIGYYNSSVISTLSAWQIATSKDANSINHSPPFISSSNLRIQSGATTLLESNGALVSETNVNDDIDGDVRPGPIGSVHGGGLRPDIGADEFDGIQGILPVNFISFTALKNANHVVLNWKVASETNSAKYIVCRAGNDGVFHELTEITSVGKELYKHVDRLPLNGENYYRLVQVDIDGTATLLDGKMVNFAFNPAAVSVYPNPTASFINVSFSAGKYNSITLYDLVGRQLQAMELSVNQTDILVDLNRYQSGIYILKFLGNSASETIKVSKQ